jgi:hypothetical protein
MEEQLRGHDLHANDRQSLHHGLGHVQRQVFEQARQCQHGDQAGQVANDLPADESFPIRRLVGCPISVLGNRPYRL